MIKFDYCSKSTFRDSRKAKERNNDVINASSLAEISIAEKFFPNKIEKNVIDIIRQFGKEGKHLFQL